MKSKDSGKEEFITFIKERKSKFISAVIILVLLILVYYIKTQINTPYLYNDSGQIIGIVKEGECNVPICLQIEKDGKLKKQEMILHFRSKKKTTEKQKVNQEQNFDTELRRIVHSIEEKKGKTIYLPKKTGKGMKLIWSRKINYRPLLLPIIFPAVVYLYFYAEKERVRKEEREYKKKIKQALPQFNHQLLLLINSGLVFSDAYRRIALSYKATEYQRDPFKKLIVDIYSESKEGINSIAKVMNEYCITLGQREFSRLVSIITEHEYKGSDLREKLQMQSDILWESRKKDAEIQGKIGETKLSFPLAILLIVLIMITAGPALLTM